MGRRNFGAKLLDGRWHPKDRLVQMKGIVQFYEKNREWLDLKQQHVKQNNREEIKRLAGSVQQLRELLKKQESGDKEAIEEVLKQDKEVYLICRKQKPQEIVESLKQMIFKQRKTVDKLFFEVNNKKEELYEVEVKTEVLRDKLKQKEVSNTTKDKEDNEKYGASYEFAKTQQDACQIVMESYKKIIGVLKKDSYYFDEVVGGLKEDAIIQSESILKIMELGQSAAEDLAWLKEETKKHAVTFNEMTKEQRKEIKNIEEKVERLEMIRAKINDYAVNKYPEFQESIKATAGNEEEEQVKEYIDLRKKLFRQIRHVLCVLTNDDIFPRLEELNNQKYELLKQLQIEKIKRDCEIFKCHRMEALLGHIENTVSEEIKGFVEEESKIRQTIDGLVEGLRAMKKEEENLRGDIEEYRWVMTKLKMMLTYIKVGAPFGMSPKTFEGNIPGREIEEARAFRNDGLSITFSIDNDDDKNSKQSSIDIKQHESESEDAHDVHPIKLYDQVLLLMKVMREQLGPELTPREVEPREMEALAEFLVEQQEAIIPTIMECIEDPKLPLRLYKPKFDDHLAQDCKNKTRCQIKFESQIVLLKNNETFRSVAKSKQQKHTSHPIGMYRNMAIIVSSSDEEEEEESAAAKPQDKKADKDVDKDEYVEDEELHLDVKDENEEAESDVDETGHKMHVCY